MGKSTFALSCWQLDHDTYWLLRTILQWLHNHGLSAWPNVQKPETYIVIVSIPAPDSGGCCFVSSPSYRSINSPNHERGQLVVLRSSEHFSSPLCVWTTQSAGNDICALGWNLCRSLSQQARYSHLEISRLGGGADDDQTGSEYKTLSALLDTNNSVHAELLAKLKRRLRTETFTAEYVLEIVNRYPDLIRTLYLTFANTHYVQTRDEDDFLPTLSYLRLRMDKVLTDSEINDLITKTVANEHHQMVMSCFQVFNRSVL